VLHGLSAPPESSSGLRRLSRTGEEEGDGGGDDDWRLWPPPQHRGCLSLLSLSLAPLMPPLLAPRLSISSLSVRALQVLTVCFVCVVWAMWRFRTRLRGDLDTARPETLAWSREVGAVLYGLPAPPGTPGGQGSIRERMECKRGGRRSSRAPVCCRANALCTASFASSSPASPSRLLSPAAERARCASPRRRRHALETRWG